MISALLQQAGGTFGDTENKTGLPLGMLANTVIGKMFQSNDKSYTVPNVPLMAMGGEMTSAKVEKDEVVETPQGQVKEIGGGTHESGNDTTLIAPSGTVVFSDRIDIDGKSLADRKKSRERKVKKLKGKMDKLAGSLEARGVDAIGKGGDERKLEKVLAELIEQSFEEQRDLAIQEAASAGEQGPEMGKGGKMQKYPYGTGGDGIFDYLNDAQQAVGLAQMYGNVGQGSEATPPNLYGGATLNPISSSAGAPEPPTDMGDAETFPGDGAAGGSGINPWYNTGSMARIFGPTAVTLMNYAGSEANPNYFQGFGREALETQGRALSTAGQSRDREVGAINRAAAAQRARGRASARGVGVSRAMDMATTGRQMAARGDAEARHSDRVSQLLGQRAQLQMQRDQVQMAGAREADIADRQDRSAFHTNLAKNLVTGGAAAQHYGNTQNLVKSLVDADISQMSDIFGALNIPQQKRQ